MPNSRKTKIDNTNVNTSATRNTGLAIPKINGMSSILLLSMFTKVNAVLTYYFRFNDTDYTFVTNSDTKGTLRALSIFPDITDKLLSGQCGNITSINNIASSLTSIWHTKVCAARFDFSRSSNQTAQTLFENCTVSSIFQPIMSDPNKECKKDLHEFAITLSILLAVGLVLVGSYLTVTIIAIRRDRQNYNPIPEPTVPASSIPSIFQNPSRVKKLLNLTSELEVSEPMKDQSPGL